MGEVTTLRRDSLLTVPDVAARLSVSPKTVYRWAKAGRIPCVYIESLLRFDRGEIDRWIAAGKEGKGSCRDA